MRKAGHVARMGDRRGAYTVLVGRPDGRRRLGRQRRTWENNIKMDISEVEWGGMDRIVLAQHLDRWWTFVNAVMSLHVP